MSNSNNERLDNCTLGTLEKTCKIDYRAHITRANLVLPFIVAGLFMIAITVNNPFYLVLIFYAMYELVKQTKELDISNKTSLERLYLASLPAQRRKSELVSEILHQYFANRALFVEFRRAEENNKDVYLIADFYDVDDNLCSTVEFTKNFNVSLNKKYTIRSLINPETPTARIKRKYRQEKAERGKQHEENINCISYLRLWLWYQQ